MHVLQHAISRLVHLHASKLVGTRYEHYGRCDHEGLPVEPLLPTTFSRHLTHTEVLLHHTQGQMDRVRMVADECGLELAVLHEDLQEAIFFCHRLIAANKKIAKRNMSLRRRIRDLQDQLASLESHMLDLEDEAVELHKENDALLSRDDDQQEAFDEEPESTDDDNRCSDNGDDRNAIMDFYAPETPSEEDPEEVVPHVSNDV
jgi:chromosome segregation ATPase